MEAIKADEPTPHTLLELARKLNEWFPELNGRAVAVSEVYVDKLNMPILPVVFVALKKQILADSPRAGSTHVREEFVIEFWMKSKRYTDKANGDEHPFWAFYNYRDLRNRLLHEFRGWITPDESKVGISTLDVEASDAAVMIAFDCFHEYKWCDELADNAGLSDWTIETKFLTPVECECNCEPEAETECV